MTNPERWEMDFQCCHIILNVQFLTKYFPEKTTKLVCLETSMAHTQERKAVNKKLS